MASAPRKLVNPILFSQHFADSAPLLASAGLFDPVLNSDSKLFIDPLLLQASGNSHMSAAHQMLRSHLKQVIKLLSVSKTKTDPAWKAARKLLDLKERAETCLGYGGASTCGSSRSSDLLETILETTKQIIDLGEDDPEIISLMAMFEEGVGPDTISDLTTKAILPALCSLTEEFCRLNGIPSRVFSSYEGKSLPENPFRPGLPIILVPRDILRDLPLAADWSDVSRVTLENEIIREEFNAFVGALSQATLAEKKEALKKAALSSLDNFRTIFSAVLGSSDSYDPDADPLNLYRFREMIGGDLSSFRQSEFSKAPPSKIELRRIVNLIIEHFRHLIESNNLWELLWHDGKPKRERAAQLLFFAVSEAFCKANNIDIAPETNPGGGPVDFRFSSGYANRFLVEIKLSKGKVVHGYKTQLGIYQNASQTDSATFLILNVGKMGTKLSEINQYKKLQTEAGHLAPEIVVVDARRRQSASVRDSLFDTINDDLDDSEEDEDGVD